MEKHRVDEWAKKKDPYTYTHTHICVCIYMYIYTHTHTHIFIYTAYKSLTSDLKTHTNKLRGWKKVLHVHGNEKKAGVAILIADKIDFIYIFIYLLNFIYLF